MKEEDFKQYNDAERAKSADQNRDDLQNEIAGREVGKQERHGVGENLDTVAAQKKEDEKRFMMAAIEDLMNDPEYAALYKETKSFVQNLMIITEEEIERANKDLEKLYDQRQELRDNANRLDDGTLIFKNQIGEVITEHDKTITDQTTLDGIVWNGTETSHEAFIENRDAIGKTLNEVDELQHYQVEKVGAALSKFDDENYRPQSEQFQKIKDGLLEEAPASIKARVEVSETSDHVKTFSHEIAEFKM
jgi:hypothetical protein